MQLIVDGDIIRAYQLLKVLMNIKSHRMPLHLPAWGYGCFAAGLFSFCSQTVTGTKVDLFKLFLFIVPCGSLLPEWRWETQHGPSGVNRGIRDGGQEPALPWGVAGQRCPRLLSTVIDIVPSDSISWSSLSTVHLVLSHSHMPFPHSEQEFSVLLTAAGWDQAQSVLLGTAGLSTLST